MTATKRRIILVGVSIVIVEFTAFVLGLLSVPGAISALVLAVVGGLEYDALKEQW